MSAFRPDAEMFVCMDPTGCYHVSWSEEQHRAKMAQVGATDEALYVRSKPVAGVEVKPTNAAEWVLVPAEPTIEMMSAAMDKMGTWIAPYTSPRESGAPTGNDISMVEATTFNTAQMDDYAVTYRAMVAAAPSGEPRVLSLEEEVKGIEQMLVEHASKHGPLFIEDIEDLFSNLRARAALKENGNG